MAGNLPTRNRGPSPRLRGKPMLSLRGAVGVRSIPAPAGETGSSLPGRKRPGVHPRACGGNSHTVWRCSRTPGPSPRLRGKRKCRWSTGTHARSIPAPAGETARIARHQFQPRVHPRACGGNPRETACGRCQGGPSPRLRGKPLEFIGPNSPGGSIPAPAGETIRVGRPGKPLRVHPRACGGNVTIRGPAGAPRGPSPRLRGKRDHPRPGRFPQGSIPAPAGETWLPTRLPRESRVHPRACGGNVEIGQIVRLHHGPSPRLRGKLGIVAGLHQDNRSIPAPAGETCLLLSQHQLMGVHPRACGGNDVIAVGEKKYAGPSPRLRGKLMPHRRG